ncbi:hypothetical protein EI94DRAFT_608039 [Lactarius quietus]|nr:hypothetical protein EI94DRAFT_608039 [Lactarius quietus]
MTFLWMSPRPSFSSFLFLIAVPCIERTSQGCVSYSTRVLVAGPEHEPELSPSRKRQVVGPRAPKKNCRSTKSSCACADPEPRRRPPSCSLKPPARHFRNVFPFISTSVLYPS